MRLIRVSPRSGFTLLELLVVIGIISLIATIVAVNSSQSIKKGRDAKRKSAISQIGRFIVQGCYVPDNNVTSIDLMDLANELISKNPNYQKLFQFVPKDPKSGSGTESKYIYIISSDQVKCALYANLEYAGEKVTLPNLSEPSPGGGQGVLRGNTVGSNDTTIYFQYSN